MAAAVYLSTVPATVLSPVRWARSKLPGAPRWIIFHSMQAGLSCSSGVELLWSGGRC